MNARSFLRHLCEAWRAGRSSGDDLLMASMTADGRVRVTRVDSADQISSGECALTAGGGAHPERDGHGATPRAAELPQGVPRLTCESDCPWAERWREALEHIAERGCELGEGWCFDRIGPYRVQRRGPGLCVPCFAQFALDPWVSAANPPAPSSPVSVTPGDEVTPSTASRDAQATAAAEGAPNVPR